MLNNITYFTSAEVQKMQGNNALLGCVYYVNKNAGKRVANDRKELAEVLAEYGANDKISAKINELDKLAESIKATANEAATLIDKAKGIDALTVTEDNEARARAFYVDNKYRKLKEIKEDDTKKDGFYKASGKLVSETIKTITARVGAFEDVTGKDTDYLKIMTKGEYKKLQTCLSNMAYKLYMDKSKYKGDDIVYLLAGSRKAKKGKVTVFGTDTVLKVMVEVINAHVLGIPDDENNK